MTDEKNLFIPLKTEWFRQFEAGTKDTEYRAYGPRWNEKTCRVGRKATVSHGYSGKRIERTVAGFSALSWADAPEVAQEIYPGAAYIAAIHLPPISITCAARIDPTTPAPVLGCRQMERWPMAAD